MAKEKTADMTGGNGHRIFVNLKGKPKIILTPGDDYKVPTPTGPTAQPGSSCPTRKATETE